VSANLNSGKYQLNNQAIETKRSSEAWVRELSGRGEVQAAAISDLSDLLRRAALYTLNHAALNGTVLAQAQAKQIAEACTRESVLAILHRLPDLRPESKFTTWAYKFVVRHTLAAARLQNEPQERTGLVKKGVEC
jgi:RNA polymerase sigma-70 factor (ECF subfamily)